MNLRKLLAVITASSFLFTMVLAQPLAAAVESQQGSAQQGSALRDAAGTGGALPGDEALAPTLGKITGAWETGSRRVVINIQDLHCHPEVQHNLTRILELLDRRYGLDKIYVEGAAGVADTSWLAGVRDGKERLRLAGSLLEQGRLTGAEYYSVQSGKTRLLNGLEDEALYRANLARLDTIIAHKDRFDAVCREMRGSVETLSGEYYSFRNKRLSTLVDRYHKGEIEAGQYYRMLLKMTREPGDAAAAPDPASYRAINDYLALTALTQRLDYARIGRQLQRYMLLLKEKLPYETYRQLLERTDNFRRSEELYEYVAGIEARYHLASGREFGALRGFFDYLALNRRLNPMDLIVEERRLLEEARTIVSQDDGEREVAFLEDFLGTFQSYLTNGLSADDYEYFAANFDRFKLLWVKYAGSEQFAALSSDLQLLADYYRTNLERNDRFIERLTAGAEAKPGTDAVAAAGLPAKGREVIVAISGGFHTQGLVKLLRARGISTVTITPNVTRDTVVSERLYAEIARHQAEILRQAFGIYLMSNQGKGAQELRIEGLLNSLSADEMRRIAARPQAFAAKALESVVGRTGRSIAEMQAAANAARDHFNATLAPVTGMRVVISEVTEQGEEARLRFVVAGTAGEARELVFTVDTKGAVSLATNRAADASAAAVQETTQKEAKVHEMRRGIFAEFIRRGEVFRMRRGGQTRIELFRGQGKQISAWDVARIQTVDFWVSPLQQAAAAVPMIAELKSNVYEKLERSRALIDESAFREAFIAANRGQLQAMADFIAASPEAPAILCQRVASLAGNGELQVRAVADELFKVAGGVDLLIVKDRLLLHEYGPFAHARRGADARSDRAIWVGEKLFSAVGISDEDRAQLLLEEAKHLVAPGLGHDVLRHDAGLAAKLRLAAELAGEVPGREECGADMGAVNDIKEILARVWKNAGSTFRKQMDEQLAGYSETERIEGFLDFLVSDNMLQMYLAKQLSFDSSNSCLDIFQKAVETGIVDAYTEKQRGLFYTLIGQTYKARPLLIKAFAQETAAYPRSKIAAALEEQYTSVERLLSDLYPDKQELVEELVQLLPSVRTMQPRNFAGSVFVQGNGLEYEVRKLREARDYYGNEEYQKIVADWRFLAGVGAILPLGIKGHDMVQEDGYILPFKVDPGASQVRTLDLPTYFLVKDVATDKEQITALRQVYREFQTNFIGANFASLELINENMHAMSKGTARQLLAQVESMVKVLEYLTPYDSKWARETFERLRSKFEGGWENLRDTDLLQPDTVRDIVVLEGSSTDGSMTLHTLINKVHSAGNRALDSVLNNGGKNMDVYYGATPIQVSNLSEEPLIRNNTITNRTLRSAMKTITSLPTPIRGEGLKVVIMDNYLSWSSKLGRHSIEFASDLSAPDEGGFIRLRFFESGTTVGNSYRRLFMARTLRKMGFDIKNDTSASGSRYLLDAVIDKDHGAVDAAQLERLMPQVIRLFSFSANLDICMQNEFYTELKGDEKEMEKFIDDLSDIYVGEGMPLGFRQNSHHKLYAEYKTYRSPEATAKREYLRTLLNKRLEEWGLPRIPGNIPFGQETINRFFTQAMEEGLERGELLRGADGAITRNPEYKPLDSLLAAIEENEEATMQTAMTLGTLPDELITWQPVGYVGRLVAEQGLAELGGGRYLVVSALKNPDNGQLLHATAIIRSGSGIARRAMGKELILLLKQNGFDRVYADAPAEPLKNLARDLMNKSMPMESGLVDQVHGISASAGSGKWVAGKVSFRRTGNKAGSILVLPYTTPDDIDAIKNAGAVVTTGGGMLSHAGITTREFGVPSVILTQAVWRGGHEDQSLTLDTYMPEEPQVVNGKGPWISKQILKRQLTVRDGDIVLVNGKSGAVTIFPQESQQALEQAYDIARRVINGDARPKELNEWMTESAKGELTGEALADCSELLVTMALENGYREGEKGYNLLVALMRMLNDKELPPIVHDRIARSFERYISARVESWTAAVEEAYREMATTQAVGRLERLYSALYDDLDDIRQLNEIQVLQTPVLTYLENGLETFHTKAVNKERRIVEDIIGKAGTLAERELSEKNLQELRKALRLAKQNGLLGETRQILLVGAGNYGRSPMAELFLKQMLAAEGITGIEVHSRGLSIEVGRDEIAKGVSQALLRNKVRGPSHTARALTSRDIEQADLVLSMDSALSRQLKDAYPLKRDRIFTLREYGRIGTGDIKGSKKEDGKVYNRMANEIKRAMEAIVENIKTAATFRSLAKTENELEERKRSRIVGDERSVYALMDLDDDYVGVVGGKAAKLGEIVQSIANLGAFVPKSVAVSTKAFGRYLKESGIEVEFTRLNQELDWLLANPTLTEEEKRNTINEYSEKIRTLIASGRLDAADGLGRELVKMVHDHGMDNGFLAVRSSAVQEDTEKAAFAGAAETYLYVTGENLLEKVKENWMSFYLPRGIQYRASQGVSQSEVEPAVLVQHMVDSDVAGVLFTVNPVTGAEEIVINASYGLGESVVSGTVQGDLYTASKSKGVESDFPLIGSKRIKIVRRQGREAGTETVANTDSERRARCLTPAQVKQLTLVAKTLEDHFGYPLDIEFAITGERIAILQARPVTTVAGKTATEIESAVTLASKGGIMPRLQERYVQGRTSQWLKANGLAVLSAEQQAQLQALQQRWADDYARNVAPWKENIVALGLGGVIAGLVAGVIFLMTGSFSMSLFLQAAYLLSWPVFVFGHYLPSDTGRLAPRSNRVMAGLIAGAAVVGQLALQLTPAFSTLPAAAAGLFALETASILFHGLVNRLASGRTSGQVLPAAARNGALSIAPLTGPARTLRNLSDRAASLWRAAATRIRAALQWPELRGKAIVNIHAEGGASALSARLNAAGINALDISFDRGQAGEWFGWIVVEGKLVGVRKAADSPAFFIAPAADQTEAFLAKASLALLAELSGSARARIRANRDRGLRGLNGLLAGYRPGLVLAEPAVAAAMLDGGLADPRLEGAAFVVKGAAAPAELTLLKKAAAFRTDLETMGTQELLRLCGGMIRTKQAESVARRSELAAGLAAGLFGLLDAAAVSRLAKEMKRNGVPRLILRGDLSKVEPKLLGIVNREGIETVYECHWTSDARETMDRLQLLKERGIREVVLDMSASSWRSEGELRETLSGIAALYSGVFFTLRARTVAAEGKQELMTVAGTARAEMGEALLKDLPANMVAERSRYREILLANLGEDLVVLLGQKAAVFSNKFRAEVYRTLGIAAETPETIYEEVWHYAAKDLPANADKVIDRAKELAAGKAPAGMEMLLDPATPAGVRLQNLLARQKAAESSGAEERSEAAAQVASFVRALAERALIARDAELEQQAVGTPGWFGSLWSEVRTAATGTAQFERLQDEQRLGRMLLLMEVLGPAAREKSVRIRRALQDGDSGLNMVASARVRALLVDLEQKSQVLSATDFGVLRDQAMAELEKSAETRDPDAVSALAALLLLYSDRKMATMQEKATMIINTNSIKAALAAA